MIIKKISRSFLKDADYQNYLINKLCGYIGQ